MPSVHTAPVSRRPLVSDDAITRLLAQTAPKKLTAADLAPAKPPKGVVPEGKEIALDWSPDLSGFTSEGLDVGGFGSFGAAIPMQILAMWAQRAEFRKISEVFATEMTRRWIDITATGDDAGKNERIDKIKAALVRFKVRDAFRRAIRYDGQMGRGHVFIDLGAEGAELEKSIGNGADAATKHKIAKGSLKGIRAVDPMWVYPKAYNTRDPLQEDFYNPQHWYVMSKPVHTTRLLTIVAREVPDLLKPSYAFGGLSLTQMANHYVSNWRRTQKSVADIVSAFSVFVLGTNLETGLMSGGTSTGQPALNDGAGLDARAMLFNLTRDNRGLMLIDKDAETFQNVSANLGGLDKLQAQAQEQMASIVSIPLVKFFGVQPAGLNASSDGEIRTFYDTVHAAQEDHLRDPLQTVIDVIQLNEFGDIDPSIQFHFEPLWAMNDKDLAEVQKIQAETGQLLVDSGVVAPAEERKRIASDPDSDYHGLDADNLPDLRKEEEEGLVLRGEEGEADLDNSEAGTDDRHEHGGAFGRRAA